MENEAGVVLYVPSGFLAFVATTTAASACENHRRARVSRTTIVRIVRLFQRFKERIGFPQTECDTAIVKDPNAPRRARMTGIMSLRNDKPTVHCATYQYVSVIEATRRHRGTLVKENSAWSPRLLSVVIPHDC